MRFTWSGTDERIYDGPSTKEGLLGGIPWGEQRWMARQLKVDSLAEMDVVGARLAYYFLTIRRTDHTLLPVDKFEELALTDFALLKHEVTELDSDGDCAECHQSLDNTAVHLPSAPVPTQPPAPQN